MDENFHNLSKKERRESRREEKEKADEKNRQSRTAKRLVFWGIVFLILAGSVYGMIKLGSSGPRETNLPLANAVSASDWTIGNPDAKVILVEYSDLQCPACKMYMPIVEKISEEFKDKILFVYRHFPLKQIHKNAEMAARATEAAGKQGAFWQMADFIFANQAAWENSPGAKELFIKYAGMLNLGVERFKADIDSSEIKNKVNTDYQSGLAIRLNSTPSFFLNGDKIKNPNGYDEFRNIIVQAIAANP